MKATEPLLQVKNLDHVTLVVRDLGKSREFYIGLLGMEEVPRPGFSFDGCWFQAGITQIHLILEADDTGPAGLPLAGGSVGGRAHHLAFRIEDAALAAARLKEKGVPLVSGPRLRPDGAVQVFLTDPDGHLIEVTSPPV